MSKDLNSFLVFRLFLFHQNRESYRFDINELTSIRTQSAELSRCGSKAEWLKESHHFPTESFTVFRASVTSALRVDTVDL